MNQKSKKEEETAAEVLQLSKYLIQLPGAARPSSQTLKPQSVLPRDRSIALPLYNLVVYTMVFVTLDTFWIVLPDRQCDACFTLTPILPKTRQVCFSQRGNAFWPCLDVLFH